MPNSKLSICLCHQRGYKQGKGKQFNKPRVPLFSKKKKLPWVGPLKYITCSDLAAASWCSMWALAPEYGQKGTKLTQSLFASLCRPLFSDRFCHLCGSQIPAHMTFFDHLCISHLKTPYNDCIASILEEGGESIMDMAAYVSSAE